MPLLLTKSYFRLMQLSPIFMYIYRNYSAMKRDVKGIAAEKRFAGLRGH